MSEAAAKSGAAAKGEVVAPGKATPGQRLKAERERRGLSAQKAADEMHLDAWVIEALESGDYQRIGPTVYAKGHMKKYAGILGLPVLEMLSGFETRVATPLLSAAPPAAVRLSTAAPAVGELPWPQLVGGALLASILIGILWWRPWHQRHGGADAQISAPDGAQPLDAAGGAVGTPDEVAGTVAGLGESLPVAPSGPMSLSPDPSAITATAAVSAPTPLAMNESDPLAGVGRARLRLSFSADSWVDVRDAAGRRVFAGKGRANSVKKIAGTAPLRVYLGFASGVQLEINDRAVAIGPQFMAGDVARFAAGADGVLRRDPRGASTGNARPRG